MFYVASQKKWKINSRENDNLGFVMFTTFINSTEL